VVQGTALPGYVEQEFDEYLECGRLDGFLRVRCDSCHAERLVAFSCKRRGFCPGCGAKRMAESAGCWRWWFDGRSHRGWSSRKNSATLTFLEGSNNRAVLLRDPVSER